MAISRKKTRRGARSVSQRSRRAVARATSMPGSTSLVTWTMVGFLSVLVAAGVAAILVENGMIENDTTRDLQSRVRSIANSRTARESLDWFSERLADLRDEFNKQFA